MSQPVTGRRCDAIGSNRRHVEESAKVYFNDWPPPRRQETQTSEPDEDRSFFGQQVHNGCERQCINSRCSDLPSKPVAYTPPPVDDMP